MRKLIKIGILVVGAVALAFTTKKVVSAVAKKRRTADYS
jgi:hypothetical protein